MILETIMNNIWETLVLERKAIDILAIYATPAMDCQLKLCWGSNQCWHGIRSLIPTTQLERTYLPGGMSGQELTNQQSLCG